MQKSELTKYSFQTNITKANFNKAARLAMKIKTAQKDIEAVLKPPLKSAFETHKLLKRTLDEQLLEYKLIEDDLKIKFEDFHKKNIQQKIDGVVFVDTLEPIVIDESKIPDCYKSFIPDMKKIREAVRMDGSLFDCPGIELKHTTKVRFYAEKS